MPYLILLFSLLTFSANAAEEKPDYAFYLISCAQYLEHRNSPKDEIHKAEDMYYITGWLSAYNHLAIYTGNVAENTDIDGVMLWLEKYCRNNPLGNMESGLYQMTQELNQAKSPPFTLHEQHPKPSFTPSFPEIPN